MINRIAAVKAPGNGRHRPLQGPVPSRFRSPSSDESLRGKLEEFLGDHPVMSLTIGFTFGIVVGCLVKRR